MSIEWINYDLDNNINPEMDDFLSDWFLNSDELKAVNEIFENNKNNLINISKENIDKLKKSIYKEFEKGLENNFSDWDTNLWNKKEKINLLIDKVKINLLIDEWLITRGEVKWIYDNIGNEDDLKKEFLSISNKEEFDKFLENNSELLSWKLVTKEDIEEQYDKNQEKRESEENQEDSVENIIDKLFIELLWRDDGIKLREWLWEDFIIELINSLSEMSEPKQRFIVTLISQYWINENKWEADKYFKDLWYKYKWDKTAWCAAIINWSLQKAWVETIQETLERENTDFKGYEDAFVNIRALAFANTKANGHVAVKIWDNMYIWWNQSRETDERRDDKVWTYNKWEVTIRKGENINLSLWYREILDNNQLGPFIKEKNSKNIPIWSIVVFARWKGNS